MHLDKDEVEAFFDDLTEGGKDECEKEADTLAADTLIDETHWKKAGLTTKSSLARVIEFSEQLRINPAIPAGRIRFQAKDYSAFKSLIGTGKVRAMFGI